MAPNKSKTKRKRRQADIDKQVNQLKRRAKPGKKAIKKSQQYKPPEARGLTAQQMQFCEEYIIDLSPKNAALRAGYAKGTALQYGHALLDKIPVKRYIAYLKVQRAKRLQVSQERIVEELARISYADHRTYYDKDGYPVPLDMITDDQQTAIKDIQFEQVRVIDYVEVADGKKLKRDKIHYTKDDIGQDKVIKRVKKYVMYDRVNALRMLGHHIGMSLDKPAEQIPAHEKDQQEVDFDALIRKLDAKQLERLTEIMLFAARAQSGVNISPDGKEVPDGHWSKQVPKGNMQ